MSESGLTRLEEDMLPLFVVDQPGKEPSELELALVELDEDDLVLGDVREDHLEGVGLVDDRDGGLLGVGEQVGDGLFVAWGLFQLEFELVGVEEGCGLGFAGFSVSRLVV